MVLKLFTTFIVVAAILASPKHRDFTWSYRSSIYRVHWLKMVIRFNHPLDKTLLANGLTNRILNAKSGLKKYLLFRLHVMKKLGSVGRKKKFFLIIFFRVFAVLNEH